MSKERMYGWNGELPEKPLSGQALIVFRGLAERKEEMHGGHRWAEIIGPELKTKQDPYRVVLYYILILKNKGVVQTNEYDITATTRTEDGKHAVTVKTQASVTARPLAEPEPAIEQ